MAAHSTPDPPHGTRAMYQREIARNMGTCEACRAAHASYHRDRNQRLRRSRSVVRTVRWEQLPLPST